MTEQEYIEKNLGKVNNLGLSEEQADGLICMGPSACEYFERVFLSLEYRMTLANCVAKSIQSGVSENVARAAAIKMHEGLA